MHASPRHPSRIRPLALPLALLFAALAQPACAGVGADSAAVRALDYDMALLNAEAAVTEGDEASDGTGNDSDADADSDAPSASSGVASGDSARRWSRDTVTIALGVITIPRYSGADRNRILPGFYVRGRVSGYAFSTRGTNLQIDLIRQRRGQTTDWKLGPVLNVRSDRSGGMGDAQVAALGKRDRAIEVGLSGGVSHTGVITSRYDQLGVRVTALQDVSGAHRSWVVSPTIEYGTPLSRRAYVGLSASVNMTGKGFGRTYFDVDPAGAAASGLPVYSGSGRKAEVGKYTIGLAGAWAVSGDLRHGLVMVGGAQYGRITGRYGASPVVARVGDPDQWVGGLGLAYQF